MSILFFKLWRSLSTDQQRSIILLLGLSIFCGICEVAMLVVAAPFFSVLTGSIAANKSVYQPSFINSELSQNAIASIFLVTSVVTACVRLTLLYFTNKIGFQIGASLGLLVYRESLLQPLEFQKAKSSSEIIAAASEKSHIIVFNVIVAALQLCGAIVVFLSIAAALILFDPLVTLSTLFLFSGFYLLIVFGFKGQISRSSRDLALFQTRLFRVLQEGLGSKRDVILHKAENYYCNMYMDAIVPLRTAQGRIHFAIQAPRFIIESAVVISIGGIFIVINSFSDGFSSMIPMLGVFALGGLKLLPITQQIYASSTAIASSRDVLQDVLDNIDCTKAQSIQGGGSVQPDSIHSFSELRLCNVSFTYNASNKRTLSKISLRIDKGERIAIIGPSGGGKSTLADLLLGLLLPSEGQLTIDGVIIDEKNVNRWHALVAHVPQDIYLADSTIAENIAIAVLREDINMSRVKEAASLAQIANMIDALPEGYDFIVGEGGNGLSGGQRQRIAIARAFYRGAQFIVLDEATSALDRELEKELLATIHNISREITIVMVTHNLESTSEFDQVFFINAGVLTQSGKEYY